MSEESNPNLKVLEDTLTLEELRREAAPAVPEREPALMDGHWLGSSGGQLRRLRLVVRALATENQKLRDRITELEAKNHELIVKGVPDD